MTAPAWLLPELMDVVRLFEGAEALSISLVQEGEMNRFEVDGESYVFAHAVVAADETERKSLIKRDAKLDLYRILSERTGKTLPWGSLTGIRPTRLAYRELERGRPFEPLFERLMVSPANIRLVGQVLEGQRGVYEAREGNCDLFVSLPFCPTKCDYCSFITAPIGRTRQYLPAYLAALERELFAAEGYLGNLRSVYIGGGTPFALEAEELERVLRAVAPLLPQGCEYTVEAGRPDTFTEQKLELCKRYGVTRICINAQSFSDDTLRAIGRKHTAEEVVRAFRMAEPFGFDVNCDLIAGLAEETPEAFARSVDEAVALSPANLTVHTLCLKKGAKLKEETARLADGSLAEMIAYSREALPSAGYAPYYLYRQKYMAGAHENVGWTKPHKACVYNVDVMEETANNLAVGANAVSKRVILSEGRIERYGSPKDIPTYLQKIDTILQEKQKLFG